MMVGKCKKMAGWRRNMGEAARLNQSCWPFGLLC